MSWIAVGAAAIGATTAIVKGAKKKKLGNQQMDRSEQLRRDAALVQKPELREEFRNVQRLKNLNTLNGMPGYAQYQDEINQSAANQLRAGKDAAGSGTDLLAYATATQAGANDMQRQLKTDDSTYRAGALQDFAQTEWAVGNEELKNIDIQRQERNKILGQSAALENSGTANKYQGTDEIIGAVGTGISQGLGAYASGSSTGYKQPAGAEVASPETQGYTTKQPQLNPITDYAQVPQTTLDQSGLSPEVIAKIKEYLAANPDADIDQIVKAYKNTRKF